MYPNASLFYKMSKFLVALENDLCKLLDWFTCNGMVVDSNKFQLMFLGLMRKQELRIIIESVNILAERTIKFLELKLDNILKFDRHIHALSQKVNRNTGAVTRLDI